MIDSRDSNDPSRPAVYHANGDVPTVSLIDASRALAERAGDSDGAPELITDLGVAVLFGKQTDARCKRYYSLER